MHGSHTHTPSTVPLQLHWSSGTSLECYPHCVQSKPFRRWAVFFAGVVGNDHWTKWCQHCPCVPFSECHHSSVLYLCLMLFSSSVFHFLFVGTHLHQHGNCHENRTSSSQLQLWTRWEWIHFFREGKCDLKKTPEAVTTTTKTLFLYSKTSLNVWSFNSLTKSSTARDSEWFIKPALRLGRARFYRGFWCSLASHCTCRPIDPSGTSPHNRVLFRSGEGSPYAHPQTLRRGKGLWIDCR